MRLLRSVIAAMLAAGVAAGQAAEQSLRFDPAHAHEFTGLGTQVWASPDFAAERDQVMRALQIRWVRLGVGPRLEEAELADHMSVADILALVERAAARPIDRQVAARYRAFAEEARGLGLRLHFVMWAPPRRWMTRFTWQGATLWRLGEDHFADYANYVAAQLVYAAGNGLHAEAIEFVNEPNTYDAEFKPPVYDRELVLVREAMDRAGFRDVGIEGPGTSQTYAAVRYLEELHRSGHLALLRAVSVHDYDTVKLPEPAGLSGLPAGLAGHLPVVVTEFGDLALRFDRPPYGGGASQRGQGNAADSAAFAVATTAEALRLIGDGAEAVAVWQLQDLNWGKGSWGLLDLAGRARPSVAALATVFAAIPAGARAIGADGLGPGLAATAFRSRGGIVVALANLDAAPRPLRLVGLGPSGLRVSGVYPAGSDPAPVREQGADAAVVVPANAVLVLSGR